MGCLCLPLQHGANAWPCIFLRSSNSGSSGVRLYGVVCLFQHVVLVLIHRFFSCRLASLVNIALHTTLSGWVVENLEVRVSTASFVCDLHTRHMLVQSPALLPQHLSFGLCYLLSV